MTANAQALKGPRGVLSRARNLAYAGPMDNAPDDSALMLRYCDGDVSAFEILYRRHNDALYRYLLRLCRQRSSAEDVFQEVWSKIIRAREGYRPTARFATWLYRIAYNCFIDHVRRNRRHRRIRTRARPSPGRRPAGTKVGTPTTRKARRAHSRRRAHYCGDP